MFISFHFYINSGSVDFFNAIFYGVVRVSFRFSGSLASEKERGRRMRSKP